MRLTIFLLILAPAFGFAQALTTAQTDSLIAGIKATVNENYVLTTNAKLVEESLQASDYYKIETIDSLVNKLNDDFYRIVNDKHLFIQYRPAVAENLANHKNIYKEQDKKERREHFGFGKVQFHESNIGYFTLDYFADATHARKYVLGYMHRLRKTTALIIDLRNNLGGSGSMIELLAGIFLEENEPGILKINYHSGKVMTMKGAMVKASKKYATNPVYLLTSDQTFSAGEAFALIMKNRGRAILVGDTTAGAGNVAGPYVINNQFVLTVPVGVIVDPMTNLGWEHDGVVPNINIGPSEALDAAIRNIAMARDRLLGQTQQ